jgi:hypothetical protein
MSSRGRRQFLVVLMADNRVFQAAVFSPQILLGQRLVRRLNLIDPGHQGTHPPKFAVVPGAE